MHDINEVNRSLYMAATHLAEAGKYLSNVEEFGAEATKLFTMADEMLGIIQPEPEKITKDRLQEVLSEIFNLDEPKEQ